MKTKNRLQITIERRSVTIIRATGNSHAARCEECGGDVTAFSPRDIAQFLGLELDEVFRRVAAADFHLTNSRRGAALICGSSLQKRESA